jgi:hypothetical protein
VIYAKPALPTASNPSMLYLLMNAESVISTMDCMKPETIIGKATPRIDLYVKGKSLLDINH